MAYQIKYVSTGETTSRYRMSGYQLLPTNRPHNNHGSHNELCNYTTTFFTPNNESNNNRYEINQRQQMNGFSNVSSDMFFKSTNHFNVFHPNMVYQHVKSRYRNYFESSMDQQLSHNMKSNYLKAMIYSKKSPRSVDLRGQNCITRCCCCGRNRLYEGERNIYQVNLNEEIVGQNTIQREHRVLREEVIIPERSFCKIRKVAEERVYTQFGGNDKNISVRQSYFPDVRMYHSFEESTGKIFSYSNIRNLKNKGNFQIDRSPLSLLGGSPISSLTIKNTLQKSPLNFECSNKLYSTINKMKEDRVYIPESSILSSLTKQNDDEREDSSCDLPIDIDTQELCRFVADELKRYSISQSTFARKVLNRSQGTLSDMLRNPKPWNQLKTGRITFVRMHKWSCLPEKERFRILVEGGRFVAPERRRRRVRPKSNKTIAEEDTKTESEYIKTEVCSSMKNNV